VIALVVKLALVGGLVHFQSPSGNINCIGGPAYQGSPAFVECLARKQSWPRLARKPASCDLDFDPATLQLGGRRHVTVGSCRGDIGPLCVNILAHDQHHICKQFAVRAADKFGGLRWRPASNGAPMIDGAVANIEASVEFEHAAGDHTIVVASVTGLHASNDRLPLLFYRGGYGGLA